MHSEDRETVGRMHLHTFREGDGRMVGILIVSHGKFSEGIIDSLRMFFGEEELKQVDSLTLSLSDDASVFGKLMEQKMQELDTGDGVIILADMLGGTPSNQSLMRLNEKVHVITGINMPLVMELINQRKFGTLNLSELIEMGKDGILDAGAKMNEVQQPVDDD